MNTRLVTDHQTKTNGEGNHDYHQTKEMEKEIMIIFF